jgi:hypothetical protein
MESLTIKDLVAYNNYLKVGVKIKREGSVYAVFNIAYDKLENEEFLTFFVSDDMLMKCHDIQSIISGEPLIDVTIFCGTNITYEKVNIEFFKTEGIRIIGVT